MEQNGSSPSPQNLPLELTLSQLNLFISSHIDASLYQCSTLLHDPISHVIHRFPTIHFSVILHSMAQIFHMVFKKILCLTPTNTKCLAHFNITTAIEDEEQNHLLISKFSPISCQFTSLTFKNAFWHLGHNPKLKIIFLIL
jgi:hypothetical protein